VLYPQDIVSEVRALNDIVDVVSGYVRLTARSGSYFGLCPFHNEKTPSFSVNRDKQFYHCFGCGAGGNVLSFVMRIENLDFPDTLKLLADRVHFELPKKSSSTAMKKQAAARETATNLNKKAARFYFEYLGSESADARSARDYLDERGINLSIRRRFGIGLSPPYRDGLLSHLSETPPEDLVSSGLAAQAKNESRFYDRFRKRLMFPIIDNRNRVVGFGGRLIEDDNDGVKQAKYINTPETALFHKSDHLYGINLARKARADALIIVEGYMDVIAMHQHGFANTVGVLGTALTDAHVRLIRNTGASSAVLILDSDEAGVRAALRAIPVLVKGGIKLKILSIPDAKDPDEYLNRFGAQQFMKLLSFAKSHIAFQVGLVREKYDLETTDGRVGFTQECAKILAELPSAIEIDAYVSEIAAESDISHGAIRTEIGKITGNSNDIILRPPRSSRPVYKALDKGIQKAKKGLINLVLNNPNAAAALEKSRCLTPEEMGGDVLGKLLGLAFENAADGKFLSPPDMMDFLQVGEEQQVLAELLSEPYVYDSEPAAAKALNDMVRRIKMSWCADQMTIHENNREIMISLQLQLKNITSLNITM